MKQQRQPSSVCAGQFWNEQGCSCDKRACWQPSPSFGIQFQLAVALQCTQRDGKEEAVMMDNQWAVFCLLTLTPNIPPPPPATVVTSLYQPLLHHFSVNHRHSVQKCWNTIFLMINYNVIYVIIQSQVHVHVTYAIDTYTV